MAEITSTIYSGTLVTPLAAWRSTSRRTSLALSTDAIPATTIFYYYRTALGASGSTTNAASIPAGAVIERFIMAVLVVGPPGPAPSGLAGYFVVLQSSGVAEAISPEAALLSMGAALTPVIVPVSTTYTAVPGDAVIADATGAGFTVTLPPAAGVVQSITVKKVDSSANVVTVDGDGAETIDGSAAYLLTGQGMSIAVVSNGTGWWVL